MLSTGNPLQTPRHIQTESERMEKYIPCKREAKESWNSNPPNRQVKLLSRVQLFATLWTVAYQAPPSMGFSRQGYWSGLPFPSPTDKIDLNIKKITRDKEGHYRMIKGSIQEERHNNCKYLCMQHRSASINKTNTVAAAAAKSLQSCPTLCDPIDGQAPLSLGFSRQGHWSGLPFPSPGDLPNPRI